MAASKWKKQKLDEKTSGDNMTASIVKLFLFMNLIHLSERSLSN